MSDNFSQRAARGQAYNLAVTTAIAEGRAHDNEYITKQFLRHLQFAALLQKADPHQLASVVGDDKLVSLMQSLTEELR